MKFENTKVTGFENAIIGLRLPMSLNFEDAKSKSDSTFYEDGTPLCIGDDDLRIMKNLIKADNKEGKSGQPNSKYLRMIHVQVAITAPLYLWKEIDTYKVGTVANSTSTMHKLASTPITKACFEHPELVWETVVEALEKLRLEYNRTKNPDLWKKLIVNLPESWLQTRMYDCNYEVLRNIASWRSNHKLSEWSEDFLNWVKTLPYAEELILGGSDE